MFTKKEEKLNIFIWIIFIKFEKRIHYFFCILCHNINKSSGYDV
jgi:hypothetical protein